MAFVRWVVVLLVVLGLTRPALADELDAVKAAGRLTWGADQEGGGPFVYPRDDDPSQVTGFEVELAEKLAAYLTVQPNFSQGPWDKMPDLVSTGKIDIVLNGYEWDPVRAEILETSIPYYVYGLQLMARADNVTVGSIDTLKKPKADGSKWQIAVLGGSAAEAWVTENLAETAVAISFDGGTDQLMKVDSGELDATLQDTPIAAFYGPSFPALHFVDKPVGHGYYVILAKKGETRLIDAINEALVVLIQNGELERIYRKYQMWDENQAELGRIAESGKFYGFSKALTAAATAPAGDAMPTAAEVNVAVKKTGFIVFQDYAWIMVQSAGITVVLSFASFPLAILLGMLIAIGRLYGPPIVRVPLTAYVEFLRGTPLMLQLYFIFFFLPLVGINVPAFATAIIGLAINYSAYESEIYRAGLQAIPPGQLEAGLALGMSRTTTLRRIIVPQAVRIVIPPVMNDFIALFKDTSVCSVVTIVELTKRFSVLSQSTQATIELMIMTAMLYLLMSYPMSILSRYVERKLEREA
jgi:polar amino acid transport system substrate-binding protein